MIPIPHLGQASAHPNEAMNSIQRMQLTDRTILPHVGSRSCSAACN